jgi:hydroxymethylbilane synthase
MIRIGSRGSTLALAQTTWVQNHIQDRFPGTRISVKVIKTSADKDTASSIRSGSGTGVFVKEIEEALLSGEIDLAVHSMKDVPTRIPDRLAIGAIPEREDPRDALITRGEAGSLEDLPAGSVIGTGSLRRQAQVLALRPDLKVADIRGNVDTRLRKLAEFTCDAIILACAGLRRLGLEDKITAPLALNRMLPAAGQGALALEIRKEDPAVGPLIAALHHPASAIAVNAERAFLRRMGGGCNVPVAVLATCAEDEVRIDGLVVAPDGSRVIRRSAAAKIDAAEEAATALAGRILDEGGKELLGALD